MLLKGRKKENIKTYFLMGYSKKYSAINRK